MKKAAFIIPGFFSSPNEKGYVEISNLLSFHEYSTHIIDIKWKYNRLEGYLQQFQKVFNEYRGDTNFIMGFSYGAMIAYITALITKPDIIFLCSLAPYFKEDLTYIPEREKSIGKRRWNDIQKYSFDEIAPKIKNEVRIFYGENEQDFVKRRARIASEMLENSKLIKVEKVGHEISNIAYIEDIKKEILLLNT